MIQIPQAIIDGIIEHSKHELPNESCGLLVGIENEVKEQYRLTNIDHSPEHFSFDPAEQFQVLRAARKNGFNIVANYHSHPSSPARPSEEDIRLAFDATILYIIVSLAESQPVIKAYRIVAGVYDEVSIEIQSQ